MSFASTALRQRERESKALRIFLACSLAGSLIFHLALLASGIGRYLLSRMPEIEDEPVEITLLDTPIEEIEPKPNEVVKPKPKPEPKKIEPKLEKLEPKLEIKQPTIDTTKIQPDLDTTPSQSRISGGSPASSLFEPIPTQPRVVPQAPPVAKPLPKPDFKPFKPFEETLSPVLPSNPPVAAKVKPVIPEQKPEPKPEPEIRTPQDFSTPVNPPLEPPAPAAEPDEDLKDLLAQERDSRRTARSFSTPVEPPTTSVPDTSGTSGSSDNAPRRRRRIIGGSNVAAAPTNTTDNGLGSGSGNSVGDGDGNAACVRCNRSYPSWARTRGIEGSITVSVDADAQGNVTDVQLISGSGNSRLDNYHMKMARRWKLKSSSNGRQGVTIITRYELQ